MADENSSDVQNENEPSKETNTAADITIEKQEEKTPDIDKLVQQALDEKLKDIKGNLDKAYNARDEALKKVAEFEQKEKEQELKRLQEEGKHREAFEMQLAEEKARREALEQENVKLSRDVSVRNALTGLDFRNEKAVEMAFKEITADLVRNDIGQWVHKDGTDLYSFVKSFAESEDNAFLFKQKVSTGGGFEAKNSDGSSGTPKSLFDLPQDQVLKLAQEGKLPNQNR